MLTSAVPALVLLIGSPSEPMPRYADASFLDYYAQAVASEKTEPRKALAMLELMLIPQDSAVAPDYSAVPEHLRSNYAAAVDRALGLWGDALGEDFPMYLASQSWGESAFTLKFVDHIAGGPNDQKGEIFVKRKVRWGRDFHFGEVTGSLTVVKFGIRNEFMSGKEVQHVVAHELGHAFGLADCDDLNRIMGPVVLGNPFARLHPDEVAKVRSIRAAIRSEISLLKKRVLP
ncbi:MAG: matrixin family metalloprotease [Fimbriimonadales bacterium]